MWLIILQACTRSDMQSVVESLKMLQQHTSFRPVMLLQFGPSMKNCPRLILMKKHRLQTLYSTCSTHDCESKHQRIASIRKCVALLLSKRIRFDKILFWGHGSGWVVGAWKRPREFLSLKELNQELFVPFQPKLLVFDACYMGSLACLMELSPSVKYLVASPGLQPYASFLELQSFFHHKKNTLKQFAVGLANEWMKWATLKTGSQGRCMLVYDVQKIQTVVAPLVKQHWATMHFDKRAQVHREDARIFDVWSASRHLPDLQRAIRKTIVNVPEHEPIPCWRVRGLTVDSKVWRKWVHLYDKSRWARYLGPDHKTHHTVPKHDSTHRSLYVYGHWLPRNLYKKKRQQKQL